MRANPDSIVLLAPMPWPLPQLNESSDDNAQLNQGDGVDMGCDQIAEMYPATWSEPLSVERTGTRELSLTFVGNSASKEHVSVVRAIVDDPIPELTEAEVYALEPLAATERVRIEKQHSLWRFVIPDGVRYGMGNATLAAKLMETLCRCQAPAIFLPAVMRLHPVGVVRTLTARYHAPDAIANLFVSAWHEGETMSTRGLTSMGLPELTTRIDSGHNAAYFRLMDLATEMMLSGKPYQLGYQIELGHERYLITEPREEIKDLEVPMAGYYGYQRIAPV